MNSSEDESLRKLLGEWKIADPLPPRFKEQVWRRVARTAETTTARELWEVWQRWLESLFARKAVALAYLTLLLAVGLTAGQVNGQAREQRGHAQLAARYIQSIDPYHKNHF